MVILEDKVHIGYFPLVQELKEICCLKLKSTRLFEKMGTHAGSAILSLMCCLFWGRQISTDTMESWENAEHILGAMPGSN